MQPQQTSSNFSPSADIQNLINAIFEQIDQKKSIREMDVKREMRALALSSEHIKEQDLDELKNSLEKVDDIISTIRHNAEPSRDPNKLILANIALAFMYGKKSHIIERIRELQSSEAIKDIADQAKKEPESTILEKIEDLVQSQFELSREVKEAREESSVYTERAKVIKEEREYFKEKWAIRRALLEKEPASVVIGAIILILITITLIITTFLHISTPQIIDNGFLVLLGYFFGQAAAKIPSDKRESI